jgi:N-acetylmuramoyl-L-alanine amidase
MCTTLACVALACVACDQPEPAPPIVSWPDESAPGSSREARGETTLATTTHGRGAEAHGELDVAGWAAQSAAPKSRAVMLEELSVYGAGDDAAGIERREVRVVLRFDGVAVYRRGELPAGEGLPRRLIVDLDGVRIGNAVPAVTRVGAGGLERVRAFVLDEERMRVSFDVEASAAYRVFFLGDPFRIVMDFRREATAGPAVAKPWTVVLDPGHGGNQPGATGPNGLKESHVALAIARRVRQALRRTAPQARVLMTRDEDRAVSLEERAAIANAVDADLFVSIHLNASHDPKDQGGLATFVLDHADDQAALRLAALENGTDIEGVTKLQFILASLYRRDQVQRSRGLAQDVQRSALRAGRKVLPGLNDRGVKSALFYVLVGAQMPAILIEGSFITRPEEAEALASDAYRQALADGIAEGIVRYLRRTPER